MNSLTIKNIHFWGTHGHSKEERSSPQPFLADITVEYDFQKGVESDDLNDVVDYKDLERITKKVLDGHPILLIERLAATIADSILKETDSYSVEITLAKVHAQSFGKPSVTYKKNRIDLPVLHTSEHLKITKETVGRLYDPKSDGILHLKDVLYKVFDKEQIVKWYKESDQSFEKKEEKYIDNNQEVSLVYNGNAKDFESFRSAQESGLHHFYKKIRSEIEKYSEVPFKKVERLETKLIKYPVSSLGVGAHRDLSSNVNIVVLMCLYGSTTFYTATDKNRAGEKSYFVEPGDIVIMRAPRNNTENDLRPIHYVLDIPEERLVFVCREIDDQLESIVNKNNWRGF